MRAGQFDTTTLEAGVIERYRASRSEAAPALALAAAALAETPRKGTPDVERGPNGPFDTLGPWGRA
jgi:hypothetical protein